ncbi:hypothetical protein D9758_018995 [Tetrapyrgos nigripes]|uniref:Uncharacterized protein n=1 Tax=Tetrapyrgos nigripes TaxID=182062 RepID=A0A8H5ES60_9AGAR|nr:hypothetical protein D9758_018995 [Tetrapyrgos nigripes]
MPSSFEVLHGSDRSDEEALPQHDLLQVRLGTKDIDEAELSDNNADSGVEAEIQAEIEGGTSLMTEEETECAEDEMDEMLGNPGQEIRPWDALRDQLKAEMKAKK